MNQIAAKALFLDRDGVINHDSGYTSRKENFIFIDGIFDLCRAAVGAGYTLFVVTNQAGIGRGLYTEQDFWELTTWMCAQFAAQHCPIQEVFYCPHHPLHGIGSYKQDSVNRKPNPGMLMDASEKYAIDMAHSVMVGDKDSDMEAAQRAGVGLRIHYIAFGRDEKQSAFATHGIRALSEAIALLSRKKILSAI